MSQPISSSEIRSFAPRMYTLLESYLRIAAESGMWQQWLSMLQDPFQKTTKGGFKLSPLWIGLGTLAAIAVSAFLYFNFSKL